MVSDTYKNNIRLIAQPPKSKPRDFHNGLEAVLKGLLDMPNVIKVRAGLRHVDVELGIFYNIKKEVETIKNHLQDKAVTKLKMGPPHNPEANVYKGVPICAFKAY